ncbi:protein ERV29 [Ascoidea rubescens DSM 1968]|uniref:SURF4-domain-containing protein n=1 Tax=Ascoidea rubescens DSM 1968 TaxID=1344418 RepID=A0A1D2VD38_9ASCO|nr:SURF4-domain-containing protein [Ascoidea rubescens DSM 1968]ODV59509.1 SURF4-domain-containing protein [Ascoidea rubescens DSM 1968]
MKNNNINYLGPVPLQKTLLENFELYTSIFEDFIDSNFSPVKPYIPAIGRFLITATFYEDSFRIISQWADQVFYLWNYRHIPYFIVVSFLFLNILTMTIASTLLVMRKQSLIATVCLICVVISQGFFYGLFSEGTFLLRNFSVIGGLLLAFSDSIISDKRSLLTAGVPMIENKDPKKYFLLAGRILLVLLFVRFIIAGSWSFSKILLILVGSISCVSIVIGFKIKFSAILLGILLTIYDFSVNFYWSYGYQDPHRDFLKYEFFQTLSIVGGLLIIVNTGAGELSIDEKKKIY